ncbi:SDR family oxidoreductase [Frondihabitans peucedani]|uniref:Uncharacterized protein n=1 Tax=Frondihabitans peucedani TaxID=598626 RepID=A0ABP8E4H6_9MICO
MNAPIEATGHVVLVPGGTGGVGEGVVRAWLAAGADVVVPTRTEERAAEFRDVLGGAATDRLHLVVQDYTTFEGAARLVEQTVGFRGSLDSVVAPVGGWWQGGRLDAITPADWAEAFTGLATAHMAVLRAALPVLSGAGAYSVVVGDSAVWPVPGSGLVSMEQAAILMMQRVAVAEATPLQRVFALQLGPVSTRHAAGAVDAVDVGRVTIAASVGEAPGRALALHDGDEVEAALRSLAPGAAPSA